MQAKALASGLRCDVFCKVVDNFGDAAVAWRIARILANEHQFAVRFFIDDTGPLAKLLGLTQLGEGTSIDHVQLIASGNAMDDVADIVIETFGCGLPVAYESALQRASLRPPWINVEYLSAESWVDDFHALPSPPGDGGAVRHFFFPGLTSATGGVLREHDLGLRREAFLADGLGRQAYWAALGVHCNVCEAPKVLIFCYTQGWPEDIFFRIAHAASTPLHLIVPEGVLSPQVKAFCGEQGQGATGRTNQLQVSVVPFLAQAEFDALLWASDGAVVRGEDSFVRAQLAGLPMLWDIYPQSENTHLRKLYAFLDRYQGNEPNEQVDRLRHISSALIDRSADFAGLFAWWCENLTSYRKTSDKWRKRLTAGPELGVELAKFARKLLEY